MNATASPMPPAAARFDARELLADRLERLARLVRRNENARTEDFEDAYTLVDECAARISRVTINRV